LVSLFKWLYCSLMHQQLRASQRLPNRNAFSLSPFIRCKNNDLTLRLFSLCAMV